MVNKKNIKRKRRKLPNGFGSITELKKRKKFWARVTTGTNRNGEPIRKSLGLYNSYNDAYKEIINYHERNYNIDFNQIITEKLFEITLESIKNKYQKSDVKSDGKKTISRYNSTFKNHYKPIKKKRFVNVSQEDIQNLIDNCEFGYDVKSNIKTVYNAMYKKAKEKGANLRNNFSEFLNLGEQTRSELHIPFTIEEIKLLWDNLYKIPHVDLVLITIYTGLRPSELCELETEKIFLEMKYAIGGIKTDAGIDRQIVFCDKIFPLIQNLYSSDNKYLLPSPLYKDKHLSYNALNNYFTEIFKILKMKHLPHDGRHTFETQLASFGVTEYLRNALSGHEQIGIGNKVYNHIPLEDKLKAVNLLNSLF